MMYYMCYPTVACGIHMWLLTPSVYVGLLTIGQRQKMFTIGTTSLFKKRVKEKGEGVASGSTPHTHTVGAHSKTESTETLIAAIKQIYAAPATTKDLFLFSATFFLSFFLIVGNKFLSSRSVYYIKNLVFRLTSFWSE